jgi:type IV pilus assembly protein PilM
MSSSLSRKIFSNIFPPPNFLQMPTVGLDITDTSIRYVQLKHTGMHFEVGTYGEQTIPKNVVEEGYIKDKMALTAILSDLQKKHNFRYVVASLPEEKSYLFKTSIPFMPERDIRNALQFKIEENVPIAMADAIFDYTVIKKTRQNKARLMSL